jgi:ribokinase
VTQRTVAVLGDVNIDLILDIPAYPPEGGEGIATAQMQLLGGSATNTARALAWLGRPVRMIGRVGQDAAGDRALADLAAAGVETRWIGRDPSEPTQTNVVIVTPGGERTMFAYRGANARLSAADVTAEALDGADLLHLSGYAFLAEAQRGAALRALDLAQAAGVPVTLDIPAGVTAEIAPHLVPVLARLDTVFLTAADLGPLCGAWATAADLIARGTVRVVVKSGAGGATLHDASGLAAHAPALEVVAIDTTGAGDALAAGQIHARLSGLDAAGCCIAGNAMGALAVTMPGAALPERAALDPRQAPVAALTRLGLLSAG